MRVAVVIPCLNEEKYLGGLLKNLGKQAEPAKVIVADCHSTDKTVEVAKKYGAKVVFAPAKSACSARNAGAKLAKTEYILFLDADTRIPDNFIENLLKKAHSKNFDSLSPRFKSHGRHLLDHINVWVINLWLLWCIKLRTKPMLIGSAFLVKKKVHDSVGGFDEKIREFDDIYYSEKLQKTKYSCGFAWNAAAAMSNRRAVRQGRIKTIIQQLPDNYFLVKKVIRPTMKRLGIRGKWEE